MLPQNRWAMLWAVIAALQIGSSVSMDQSSPLPFSNSGLFAADLLAKIAKTKLTENVIFSPLSIQSALAMTYLGAEGKTAEELKNGLRLPSSDKDKVGEHFAQILNKRSGHTELSIANRIFVNSDYQLQDDFNRRSENYFHSGAEALNFNDKPSESVETINNWVEKQTNNNIKKLMQPGSVDSDTTAVIVNAIYFKGVWTETFLKEKTRKSAFWNSKNESVDVDMMFGDHHFLKYGDLPELDATAVDMPYKNSDISMLIILPSQKDGLADLELKLSSIDINELSSKMRTSNVRLMIPKFKAVFSTQLTSVLKDMGIRSLFENADLPGIFQSGVPVKISDAQHKAFIEVNEFGTEAAGATYLSSTRMFRSYNTEFKVDRPFFFAIKDSSAIYFVGHVAKL